MSLVRARYGRNTIKAENFILKDPSKIKIQEIKSSLL